LIFWSQLQYKQGKNVKKCFETVTVLDVSTYLWIFANIWSQNMIKILAIKYFLLLLWRQWHILSSHLWQQSWKRWTRPFLKTSPNLTEIDWKWGEAPWSSGECWGLTIQPTVLGRGFESRLCLKTRWKRWTTWWQKNNKNNKDSQMGQVTPKTNI